MPRKSLAALSVAAMTAPRSVAPLKPPRGMSTTQRMVWRNTVEALPGDWFTREHVALLRRYCEHVARADDIERRLARLDPIADGDDYDRLARLGIAETGRLLALARAMRLTQQSRLKAETAANRAGAVKAGPRPWDVPGAAA